MVDFQSRDTRRGPTTDDDESESADDDQPAEEGADDAEGTAGDEGASETDREQPETDATVEQADSGQSDASAETEAAESRAANEPAEAASGAGATDAEATEEGGGAVPSGAGPGDASEAGGADPLAEPAAAKATAGGAVGSAEQPGAEGEPATPSRSIAVGVVTVGTDGEEDVEAAVADAFEAAGHTITVRERLQGEYDTIQQVVDRLVAREDVDAVVTAGGVGIAAEDRTIEAVHPLLEKALPGFGEAFRTLLFEVIGTGIVAVRSTAGVSKGTLVFCLPGDPEAATLAVDEILAVEAPELVAHLDD